jgi:hypothetical protein
VIMYWGLYANLIVVTYTCKCFGKLACKERQLLCIDLLNVMVKFEILLGALQKSVAWSYEI